ncbi:unnamed protein product [Tuber melanosporum]|uniref:(Perigord truffle) hypothetical protein n=1 Tax=Tuber melanosporum (strain Mel28) TaxID=656061 RepID=D5GEZ4_TUBMM|nr:uncharacterized protein GSTUM_00006671001 [Tuber melanosporum]CAZ83087.1 unnamed protein product [Tuber melanosporum]
METSSTPTFHRQDAISLGVRGILYGSGAGAFISAMQNTLTKSPVGAASFITRTGGVIGLGAAMGGSYMFFRAASANLRGVDDSINPTVGGAVAGALLGIRVRTMPGVVGCGIGLGVAMGIFEYTGGALGRRFSGDGGGWARDEVERKEGVRARTRRDIKETIGVLGEGRGIYGPGWEERRRARLTEKYGVNFDEVK